MAADISQEQFLDAFANAYWLREVHFRSNGFLPIRDAWMGKAARLGQEITVQSGNRAQTGIFETVDEDGQLVLSTPEGSKHFAAADVYFD